MTTHAPPPQALDVVVEALLKFNRMWASPSEPDAAAAARILLAKLAALDESRRAAQEEATMTTPSTPALALVIEELASRKHYECEDSWYSCPLSDEGCANEHMPKECTCGASRDHELAALLQNLAPPDAIRAAEPVAWRYAGGGMWMDMPPSDEDRLVWGSSLQYACLCDPPTNDPITAPSPPAHEHGQGWKLVPVEPTVAMINTGNDVASTLAITGDYSAALVWAQMLTAAPEPPRD